jgi:DNA-binding transcriptional MerR regulator
MRDPSLLTIGEFAHLGHVSIATLHHYDEYGLLKPAALDPKTGYRSYTFAQLSRLHRILALKDFGFSLDEIAQLLHSDLAPDHLRKMLQRQQRATEQALLADELRLRQLVAWVRHLEDEETMPEYAIRLQQVDLVLIASMRKHLPHLREYGPLLTGVEAYLGQHGIPPSRTEVLLLHSPHTWRDGQSAIDLEVAIPLVRVLPDQEPIHILMLPGGLVASTIHTGATVALGRAYLTLHQWMEVQGYALIGPVRQWQVHRSLGREPEQVVTEVQFPVARRLGKKRASVAMAHSILVMIYHILRTKKPYTDLGSHYFDQLDAERVQHHHIHHLEQLGYIVTLTPVGTA